MNTVVDMDQFGLDPQLEELARKRYSMPPVVIAALKQAGQKATQRLANMVMDDKTFGSLSPKDQLFVIREVMDRAYGKSETAASNDLANQRLNGADGNGTDHASQLEEIAKREALNKRSRRGLPSPKDVLASMDQQYGFSEDGPYPSSEEGEGRTSPSPTSGRGAERRNRPVPPSENVVALRRGH